MNKEYKTFEELKEELGDKFEEFMCKANIELLEKVNQLEINRDEAIDFIKKTQFDCGEFNCCGFGIWKDGRNELLEILERGKE